MGGLVAEPLGLDEVFKQLRHGTTALECELFREVANFRVDREVEFPAEFAVWVGYSWHMLCVFLVFWDHGLRPAIRAHNRVIPKKRQEGAHLFVRIRRFLCESA